MSIKFLIVIALTISLSCGENQLLQTLLKAATSKDFKLDRLGGIFGATEDGGITLPPFRFRLPFDVAFVYCIVDFTSQNTTVYGLREAETNVAVNFSGEKLTFEGWFNASRLFFVGDFVSNSYEGTPFLPDVVIRYVGEDEYFAELKDLFVSFKFTLNTPLTGNISMTDYEMGFNDLFDFKWNFKNVARVYGDTRFELDDQWWEGNSENVEWLIRRVFALYMPHLDCVINQIFGNCSILELIGGQFGCLDPYLDFYQCFAQDGSKRAQR